MANFEACQVYIEQEIDEAISKGKKPHTIGKQLSELVDKLFEAKIPAATLKKRAERRLAKLSSAREIVAPGDKCHLSPIEKTIARLLKQIDGIEKANFEGKALPGDEVKSALVDLQSAIENVLEILGAE